jgi:hypothetical protein
VCGEFAYRGLGSVWRFGMRRGPLSHHDEYHTPVRRDYRRNHCDASLVTVNLPGRPLPIRSTVTGSPLHLREEGFLDSIADHSFCQVYRSIRSCKITGRLMQILTAASRAHQLLTSHCISLLDLTHIELLITVDLSCILEYVESFNFRSGLPCPYHVLG